MSLFDSHYGKGDTVPCAECGKDFAVSEMAFLEDEGWFCRECAGQTGLVECADCHKLYAPEDVSQRDDGSVVCLDCDSDLYWSTHE